VGCIGARGVGLWGLAMGEWVGLLLCGPLCESGPDPPLACTPGSGAVSWNMLHLSRLGPAPPLQEYVPDLGWFLVPV
jgi:hypothetical protein